MNLYFRLFKLLCQRFFFHRPLGLLDISVIQGRVWPNDLDNNLHMNNGRYLTLMDLGRLDLLLRAGLFYPCLKNRWFPVVGALKIIYAKPLKPFQAFKLKTRVLGWDAKWLYLEQWFEAEGHLAAKAVLQGLFHGPQGKVPTRKLLQTLGWKKSSPRLPGEIRRWLRPER